MSNSSQPAWHPDPEGVPDQLRWWDGQQWTSATRPAQSAPPPPPLPKKSSTKTALIISGAIVGVFIVLAAVGAVFGGDEGKDTANSGPTTPIVNVPVQTGPVTPRTTATTPPAARSTQTVSQLPCEIPAEAYVSMIELSLIDSSLSLANLQSLTAPGGLVYIGADIMRGDERESSQDTWVIKDDVPYALSSSANEFTVLPDGRDLLDVNISAGDEYGSALQNCVARLRQGG